MVVAVLVLAMTPVVLAVSLPALMGMPAVVVAARERASPTADKACKRTRARLDRGVDICTWGARSLPARGRGLARVRVRPRTSTGQG